MARWYRNGFSVMGETYPGHYMEFVSDSEYYEYLEDDEDDEERKQENS